MKKCLQLAANTGVNSTLIITDLPLHHFFFTAHMIVLEKRSLIVQNMKSCKRLVKCTSHIVAA